MRFSAPLYTKMIKNLYSGICRAILQLICSLRHVFLPQKWSCFSVTIAVFALESPFCGIDTEKAFCFCETMRSGPPRASGAYPYAPAPRAAAALTLNRNPLIFLFQSVLLPLRMPGTPSLRGGLQTLFPEGLRLPDLLLPDHICIRR